MGKSAAPPSLVTITTSHPHAGGEISPSPALLPRNTGPSPRGWGNLFGYFELRPKARAIPTRVGKSGQHQVGRTAAPGHPHAGGEIPPRQPVSTPPGGPSPRGWGNPPTHRSGRSQRRAIPTRVGKSAWMPHIRVTSAGHPHAGGEITSNINMKTNIYGPSPRGWGNLCTLKVSRKVNRAIPTRVGKSTTGWSEKEIRAGHPHAGGEILPSVEMTERAIGPSPRGWGNRSSSKASAPAARAIPTRVGKSTPAFIPPSLHPGHPHAGGEIFGSGAVATSSDGPSPRGWGNLQRPS